MTMPHPMRISGATLGALAALLLASLAVPAVVGAAEDPAAQVPAGDHSGHQMDHSGHQMDHSEHAMDHSKHEMDHSEHAMDHSAHGAGQDGGDDPHAAHRAMMQQTGYRRSEHQYSLNDRKLVRMDGEAISLLEELDSDRPVMVNFIFTTCTTICPVMSATFAQVQQQLGPDAEKLHMVSISIDPEHDTPARLREYAERFTAGPQWDFYTGDLGDIIGVQKDFDVYRGSKMNHEPTTLMRKSEADPWVRIDGLASGKDIVKEYRQLSGE